MKFWDLISLEKHYLWMVLLFSLLLFFPYLGARDFWAPVEPRYAEIARVMFAKGEWIVPTVNGDLYTDKPILYFWLVLAASKLAGGVNEWTVRLPAALSAAGLVLTVYFLARDLFTAKIGFMAALILATCARVIWEGRWAHTDMLLALLLTLSLYCFSRVLFGIGSRKESLFSYALIALATLTKGLIGFVLPGMILMAFIALRREWRRILDWRLPWGILIFLAVTAPWFASVTYATDGKWLSDFIWIHHFQRYTSGSGHRQPLYYYLTTLPADFLPWTFFAAPALLFYRTRLKDLRQPIPLFLCVWFSVIFLFFSISDTKRDLYLLPAFPPLAIFMACYFDELISGEFPQTKLHHWLGWLLFGIFVVNGLFLPVVTLLLRKEAIWISIPVSVAMVAGGAIGIASLRSRQPGTVFLSTALAVALFTLSAAVWLLPFIDQYKSARAFALEINRKVPMAQPLYIYADSMNDFNFYTGRDVIPILSSPDEVKSLLQKVKNAYLLVREKNLREVESTAKTAVLADGGVGSKQWRLVEVAE